MKNYAVSLFILVSFFIYGCEDSYVNNPTEEAQKRVTEQRNQQAETKKQSAKQKMVKSVVNKQPFEVSSKHDDKPPQIAEQVQEQQTLDLSIPLKIPETKNSGNASSNEKRNYLPDLFADQKDQKNKSMQVDGKVIRREEEEEGKHKIVDGGGINIKLTH